MSANPNGRAFEEDLFAKAKELSLKAFIEDELGVTGRPAAGWTRYPACPNCGEGKKDSVRLAVHSDDRHWKYHRCGEDGTIIDAAMFVWGCSNIEAAQKLLGVTDRGPRRAAAAYDREADEAAMRARALIMQRAFKRLQEAAQEFKNEPRCLAYLTQKRKIPLGIVREAQARGMVGFMPSKASRAKEVMISAVGEDLLREAGLWKPDSKLPGISYRPLVFFMPNMTCAEFRVIDEMKADWTKSIAYGPKTYPYWWQGTDQQCLIAEGLIDTLSAVALGYRGHVMGLPGCNTIRTDWFVKAAAKHKIARYVIGLDNDVDDPDNPGQTWARKISAMLNEASLPNFIKAPERGDLNDILRERAAAQKK